jgi:ferrous iron transport protein B
MLLATGCGVPGIMACRSIETPSERRMTLMSVTFIPCAAKLPVIALISSAVLGGAWWVAPCAYFAGITAVVVSGLLLKRTKPFAGAATPFIMELPAYRLPSARAVFGSMWERGWAFIKKAGTVILLASVVIWYVSGFGPRGGFGEIEPGGSYLAVFGGALAPVFAPLGWGFWQAAVAALAGLVAKENIVGTLGVLYGAGSPAADFTPLSGCSFLLFNLLCAPCLAAMAAMARELGGKRWFAFAIGYQCAFAYIAALCVYRLGALFGG